MIIHILKIILSTGVLISSTWVLGAQDLKVIIDIASQTIYSEESLNANIYLIMPSNGSLVDMSFSKGTVTRDSVNNCFSFQYIDDEPYDYLAESPFKSIFIHIDYAINNVLYVKDTTIQYHVLNNSWHTYYSITDRVFCLYRSCGNELLVGLKGSDLRHIEQNGISFTCTGAKFKFDEYGYVILEPDSISENVLLKIYKGNVLMDSVMYTIVEVPLPYLIVTTKGSLSDQHTISESTTSIQVKGRYPDSFASFLPRDARFNLNEIEYSIYRNGKMILKECIKDDGARMVIPTTSIKSGDYIYIKVLKATRQNYIKKNFVVSDIPDRVIYVH